MVRAPYLDKNGIRKGAWSREEDEKLRAYIQKYGHWNWRELPMFAGLSRCGKSCRLRWMNYLRPDVKHGSYSKEEEDLISNLHKQFGNKWSLIAAKLPGRTDSDIKNYWHTHLKKKSNTNQATSDLEPQSNHKTSVLTEHDESKAHSFAFCGPSNPILESSPFIPETSCSTDFSNVSGDFDPTSTDGISNWINKFVEDSFTSFEVLHDSIEDFWTQPFVAEKDLYDQVGYSMSSLDKESLLHYASTCDDSTDLFYQVMQELPTT